MGVGGWGGEGGGGGMTSVVSPGVTSPVSQCYGFVNPNISKENALNLLEELISLFLRIRSHSFAKDITKNHKMKSKRSKERSLRTSIKRASDSLEFDHYCFVI